MSTYTAPVGLPVPRVATVIAGQDPDGNTIIVKTDENGYLIVSGGGGGGGAVTIADGADVAEGATADGAWSGSGAGTVVSILKKIAVGGSGGGPVTVADGADVTQGTKADGAATDATSAWTVVSILKGLYAKLAGTLTVTGPLTDAQLRATPVPVSLATSPTTAVTIADGADVAQGAKADAAATDSTSSWTVVAILKGLWAKLAILSAQVLDYDTGAGTAAQAIFGIALPANGGPVAGGTTLNPLTVNANAGTNLNTSGLLTTTDFDNRIGEVQASPTANTVLDRLKALLTGTILAAGSAIIGKVGIDQTTPGTTNGVQVNAALPAGTNLLGSVNVLPATAGGWLVANMTSGDGSTALTNAAQAIKASAGQLGGWFIFNPNTVVIYVLLYNVAAASVTVGTTNPQIVLAIPPGAAANLELTNGIQFTNAGFSAAASSAAATSVAPTTALDANFFYK